MGLTNKGIDQRINRCVIFERKQFTKLTIFLTKSIKWELS